MQAGKVWGKTELIEANGALEFHRIEMEKGGVCSKHLHEFKWNGFYIETGQMLVRVWQNDYDLVDETLLREGDYTKVKPGLYHQFECVQSGIAYELYWAEFNHNDIKRESVGTLKTPTYIIEKENEYISKDPRDVHGNFPEDTTEGSFDMNIDWNNITLDSGVGGK
jgi:mannose-6-phosphate isomerase-like protein (cupin superfamily)